MSWAPALSLAGIAFAVISLFIAIHPKRSNRRRGLPPPSERTLRSPDWRRYELQTPRKYIP